MAAGVTLTSAFRAEIASRAVSHWECAASYIGDVKVQVADSKNAFIDSGLREIYAMQHLDNETIEHDPRGLVIAVFLSVACWAVLGFFLLS